MSTVKMKYFIRLKQFAIVAILIIGNGMSKTIKAQVEIGIFADCQYCNCEPVGNRYYRNSLDKLEACISEFNKDNTIDFVVGLGDLIDKDFDSFKDVNSILKHSNNKVYHITGNHDYSVKPVYFDEVLKQLNLTESYYTIEHKKWQFIFLNGNDITYSSNDKEIIKQAENLVSNLTNTMQPNNKEWNGGIGQTQISWLINQLENAEKKQLKVILFCHYPLLPLEAHALWNSKEMLATIGKYSCVKAWINGHNHAGAYAQQDGVHFITLKGMVDTKTENAYSIISLSENEIEVNGFGRQESKKLLVK